MAIAPPELTVKIKFDTNDQQRESAKLARDMEARAKKLESTLSEQTAKGEAQRENIRKKALAQKEADELRSQTRIDNKKREMLASVALSEERARLKSLKGQESWSARMTKSLDSVALSIKGFAIAWGTAQVASMVRGSLELAGGMREAAAGAQVTTQQYFALTSALRDAGVQAEKIEPMFVRLNDLVSGGASPEQQTILDRLGINATGMTNVQLMDTLLEKINGRLITQADLGNLVGYRVVPAWNMLANEIGNVNEANSRYKFPLTDVEVKKLDEAARAWDTFKVSGQLAIADLTLSLSGFFKWYRARIREDLGIEAPQPLPLLPGIAESLGMVSGRYSLPEQTIIASAPPRGGDGASLPPVRPNRRLTSIYGNQFQSDDAVLGGRFSNMRTGVLAPVNTEQIRVMARELPTITRELENSANFAERLSESVNKFSNSNTWQVAQAGAQAFGSIMSLQAQVLQGEVDALQQIMAMEEQRWQDKVRLAEAAGTASSAAFRNEAREHEKIEKQRQKKLKDLQAKGWEQNKLSGISNTVMSTAQGVMQAFASPDLPAFTKLIMAALVSSTGAAQIAMISSQKNPYKGYAFGGYVPGQSLGDDTMINVTGGEFVSNRQATQQNRAALEYANKGGIVRPDGMSGGITVIIQGDIVGDDSYVESRLIPRLQRAIDRGYKLRVNG